jgi:hypothetical protein
VVCGARSINDRNPGFTAINPRTRRNWFVSAQDTKAPACRARIESSCRPSLRQESDSQFNVSCLQSSFSAACLREKSMPKDRNKLMAELDDVPTGKIPERMTSRILAMLGECWEALIGSDETSMNFLKLHRAEDLSWNPPNLSFTIERHGATVLGSSRAELHRWTINLRTGTARCERGGYRQLFPRAPGLNVKPIAAQVCEAVKPGPLSSCELVRRGIVVFNGDDEVLIKHGALVSGGGPQQTVAGRRRRFRSELIGRMKTIGWEFVEVRRKMRFKRTSEVA